MRVFSLAASVSLLASTLISASEVPEFMESFVNENTGEPSEQVALDNLYSLNDRMFNIYDKSLGIYKKNFLDRHHLIMGLFSGKGGRFILYRPGQPPLEADPVPFIYQVAKSIGHTAMATFQLLAPYTADPSADLAWLGSLKSYRTNVQTSLDSLKDIDLKPEERKLFIDTLNQIAAFMDKCLQKGTYTYQEIQKFTRAIQPNLGKLIDIATNAQVRHWWSVLEEWKQMLGKDWETTYALSNSIYVARQNNILFSILVQFFGEQAINERLMLLETTDFTTTPELMMDAFIRIVSDRMIGEAFFKEAPLMDFELLGGSARKVIEDEAKAHGTKAILPPLVPYNSHGWPWKTDVKSGTGPALMEEIH